MNAAQKHAMLALEDTGALKAMRDEIKKTLFEMWIAAPDDEVRLQLGHKVDVVDETFVLIEETLIEASINSEQ